MYCTVWKAESKYLSHMKVCFTDSLVTELEIPTQKDWALMFFHTNPERKRRSWIKRSVFHSKGNPTPESKYLWLQIKSFLSFPTIQQHFEMKSEAEKGQNMPLRHFLHIISDPFVKFVIIWNKWRHSFQAQCAHWHGNECFPAIIHQFNAECDPACEYLTAVHASLICIPLTLSLSLTLSASLSFSLSLYCLFLSIHRQISGISLASYSSIKARETGRSFFPFLLSSTSTPWSSYFIPYNICNRRFLRKKFI